MPNQTNSAISEAKWIVIVFLLSWVSATQDVISYMSLHHVFTANMTGNTVLLGMAIGQRDFAAAVRSLSSLVGYVCGVAVGALIVDRRERNTVKVAVTAETVALAAFAALFRAHSTENMGIVLGLISLSGIAMGMQSATVKKFDLPGIVTTYITGTITTFTLGTVRRLRHLPMPESEQRAHPRIDWERRLELQAGVFIVYIVSAITSVLVSRSSRVAAAVLPVLAIGLVLGTLFLPGRDPRVALE